MMYREKSSEEQPLEPLNRENNNNLLGQLEEDAYEEPKEEINWLHDESSSIHFT